MVICSRKYRNVMALMGKNQWSDQPDTLARKYVFFSKMHNTAPFINDALLVSHT